MILLWNILLTRSIIARRLTLWLARRLGRVRRSLRNEWISPIICLIVSAVGVWLVEGLQHFNAAKAGTVFHGWTSETLLAIFMGIVSGVYAFLMGIWSYWLLVVTVYVILTLLIWVWQARKRVVVEEFVDYTNDEVKSDKSKTVVDGLATLLVVRLGRLRDLYREVDERRAIPTSVWVNQSIDATIDVGNLTEFLKDAVSAQAEFSLGALKIPVGTLLSFFGRIVQGPRIMGSLHKDKDLLILTAQRIDSKQSLSWQVEGPIPSEQPGQLENDSLKGMTEELACRMFTDLALSGSVRWRATAKFSEGLHAYRECLHAPKDRRVNLERAEKKFIETLAEDQKFDLAYYNLGVVYTELRQTKAAEIAFMDAISQNPAFWNAYYALAMNRFQNTKEAQQSTRSKTDQDEAEHEHALFKMQYESIVELCSRVIELKPGMANSAKAYQLRGQAQDQLLKLKNHELHEFIGYTRNLKTKNSEELPQDQKDDIKRLKKAQLKYRKDARRSRRKAIGYSWRALCDAELMRKDLSSTENTRIGQLETLASICLTNQAVADKFQRNLRRAEALLRQALYLNHSDADYYAYYHSELGRTYFMLGRINKSEEYYYKAVREYKHAIRISPEKIDFWASLALAYASLGDKENALDACEKVLDYAPLASKEILEEAFQRTTQASNLIDETTETHRRIAIMRRFLKKQSEVREVVEELKDGELTVDDFKKVLNSKLEQFANEPEIEDQAWGYALVASELGNLDINADKTRELEEHFKHDYHESGYAQGFLTLGSLGADDAKLIKVTKYHRRAIDQLNAILNQPDSGHYDWECGQIFRVQGLLYLDLGEPEKAEHCFQEAIKNLEKKHFREIRLYKLRVLLAQALLNQGKQEKTLQALQEVKRALALDSLGHEEREVLGDVYFRLKEFDQAICAWQDAFLWRNALLREPVTATLYYKIGNAHVELARHYLDLSRRRDALQEAVKYLKQALELYKYDQREQRGLTCYLLGTIHLELSKYWEAVTYLRVSQMLGFAPLASTFWLGYGYLKNREYGESLRQFDSLLKDNAQWKIQDKRIDEIVEADPRVNISLTKGEILAWAKWGKAVVYVECEVNLQDALGLVNQAEEHIDALVQHHAIEVPLRARYKDYIGWIYFKLGQVTNAIQYLKQALALAAQAEIYLHLALVHESQLQKSKDIAEIEALLEQVRTYCQHVQQLDINGEWDQSVKDLQQRLQEKTQEVQQMKAQVNGKPEQANGSNLLKALSFLKLF